MAGRTASETRSITATACSCGDGCGSAVTVDVARIETMSVDFEAVVGRKPNGFGCPLCGHEVDAGCVSDAHAPSRRVGGCVVTLTCRRCISQLGTRYEGAAVRMLRTHIDGMTGTWTERLEFGSGDPGRNLIGVDVTFTVDESGSLTRLDIHGPRRTAAAGRWAEEAQRIVANGFRGAFRGRAVPQGRIGRAFLYWAFLMLAGELGYAFAGAPGSRVVAQALLNPASTTLGERFRLNVPLGTRHSPSDIVPSQPFIWSTTEDPGRPDAVGWRFGDWLCLLPWPTDGTGELYRRLDAMMAAGRDSFGRGWMLPDSDVLRQIYRVPVIAA